MGIENIDYGSLKVGIVTLTVGHWDLMGPHIDSLMGTYPYPKEIYIIPNTRFEMSLSAALNKGFKRAVDDQCDYIVYCADDVTAGDDSVQQLLASLIESKHWIIHGRGPNTAGWDFFAIRPIILKTVGYFDEDFYPAYFEDNDFARRLSMKAVAYGKDLWDYVPINMQHLGSQTLQRMTDPQRDAHDYDFQQNEKRFKEKWGGLAGSEVYTQPWDGKFPENYDFEKYWPSTLDYSQFPGF